MSIYSPAAIPENEHARQAALVSSGLLHADLAFRLSGVVAEARSIAGTQVAALTAISGDQNLIIAADGAFDVASSRAKSFCGHAILNAWDVFCIPDASKDARFASNPIVTDLPGIRFYAGVPLVSEGEYAIGTLGVFDREPRPFLSQLQTNELRILSAKVVKLLLQHRRA